MAMGSSAPEILIALLETATTLGDCPGELGASTIVGSAAFNLLVISGVSIIAVNEENDTHPERNKECPLGVKKIYDMGVFTIASIFSIWAYVWLYIALMDENILIWEAWFTFGNFILLVLCCFAADKYKAAIEAKKNEGKE